MYEKVQTRRLVWVLLAGTLAFLLALGLSLVLSRSQALAQPALEVTAPNLDVQKDVNTSLAAPGETLAYTITIHNSGDTSAAVWLTDVLPSDLTCIPDSLDANYGTPVLASGVINWSESVGVEQTARIWFHATVSPEITATQIENTAQVTGTGQLLMDSAETTILSGALPTSQIRSPQNGAVITQKGTLTISGVAWDASIPRPFPGDPVLLPINNYEGGGEYNVEWTAAISAENYVLEEAKGDPEFDAPDYTDSTSDTKYFIAGRDPGTYYYRVRAYNAAGRPGRWSNVESVVVVTLARTSGSSAAAVIPSALNVPDQSATDGTMTVWVRIDTGAWQTATVTSNAGGWWDWTYNWALPEENDVTHTIHTQAQDAVGNFSAIDTITVILRNKNYIAYMPLIFRRWPPIPDTPVLNPISNPDGDGNYTVSWNAAYLADTYTLEEDNNSAFSSPATRYTGSGTSWGASNQASGTYYYRVKASNSWGDSGWSTVRSVTVIPPGYRDDFHAATNWAYRRGDDIIDHSDIFRIRYRDDKLYMLFVGSGDFAVASPMEKAPAVPYTIRARVRVVRDEVFDGRNFTIDYGNGHDFGIVFGGNSGTPCPADRRAAKGQGCLSHYYRLIMTYDKQHLNDPHWTLKKIEYHDPNDDGKGKGTLKVEGTASGVNVRDWMEWKIEVTTSGIKVYINGQYRDRLNSTSYINDPYFGFFMSSAVDGGDIGVKWDWIEVEK